MSMGGMERVESGLQPTGCASEESMVPFLKKSSMFSMSTSSLSI